MTYTITREDADGAFRPKIPDDMIAKSRLKALPFTQSVVEALGERFHASPALLRRLNPRAKFAAAESIRVPNVAPVPGETAPTPGIVVTVSKNESSLTVTDSGGKVLFFAPVTAAASTARCRLGGGR